MENKLEKIGQNNFMDNFVKTDDILKDMCGIIEESMPIIALGGRFVIAISVFPTSSSGS